MPGQQHRPPESRNASTSTTSAVAPATTPTSAPAEEEARGNAAAQESLVEAEGSGGQAGATGGGAPAAGAPPAGAPPAAAGGGGDPLPFRAEMEAAFGQDFSDVRVHLGAVGPTAAIDANAFVKGDEIWFADRQPDARTVAAELVHVVQNRGASAPAGVSSPADASEVESERIADQVARGGGAGPIAAEPEAAVQRDPTDRAVCFETREVAEGDVTIVVHPDADRAVPRRPGTDRKWHTTEGELEAFRRRLVQMAEVRVRVLDAARTRSGHADFATRVQSALRGVPPDVKAMLRVDPVFLADEIFAADPSKLVRIVDEMSPGALLRESLTEAVRTGSTGEALVTLCREFATANPADGVAAISDPAVMGALNQHLSDTRQRLRAIAYLSNGGTEGNATTRLRLALETANVADFNTAFEEVCDDPAQFGALRNDAEFLRRVRAQLGDAVWQSVQQQLISGASAPGTDLGLTAEELGAVRTLAGTCTSALRAEFDATFYTSDANVESALTTYFSGVSNLLRAVTDADARDAKTEQARTLLKDLYVDTYRTTIAAGILAGVDEPTRGRCLALIRAVPEHTPEAIEARRAEESGDEAAAGESDAGPPLHLTDEERQRLQAPLDAALTTLKAELIDAIVYTSNANVRAAVRTYETAVDEAIPVSEDDALEVRNAARRRNNEGRLLLESEYASRNPGHDLAADIASGVGGLEAQACQDFLESARVVADEVAEASTYEAPAGAPLSAAEQQRLEPLVRQYARSTHTGSEALLGGNLMSMNLTLARNAIRRAVSPESAGFEGDVTAAVQHAWDLKTAAGMALLRTEYDLQFGSLVGDLHASVSDLGALNRCLQWVGDRASPVQATVDEAIAGLAPAGTPEEQERQRAFAEKLDQFQMAITRLAERFAEELDDSVVYDDRILAMCDDYVTYRDTTYADLVGVSEHFTSRSYLEYLTRAFVPLGGSLPHAIAAGLDRENAETAFQRLGLGSVSAALVRVDETGLSSAEIDVARELVRPVDSLFAAVDRLQWVNGPSGRPARRSQTRVVVTWLRDVMGLAEALTNPTAFVDDFYRRQKGIGLGVHLGRVVPVGERQDIEEAVPALALGAFGGVSTEEVDANRDAAIAAARPEGDAEVPEDLRFDPLRVSRGFTIEVAADRATAIHRALGGRGGPAPDRAEMTRLLTGENGFAEETRVVRAMYRRMYGVTLEYELNARFPYGGDDREILLHLAETGGGDAGLVDEVRMNTRLGTDAALNEIYSRVLMASSAERQALLDDPGVLYEVQRRFGHEAMDRVYRSATGEVTLADMLRTRDTSTEWYTFGIGTDEENSREDVTLFFRYLRNQLRPPGGDAGTPEERQARAAALDAAVRDRARQMFADHDVRQILDAEFGGEELLQIEQLILGAGTRSATDEVTYDLADANDTNLVAHLRALSTAERTALRGDPAFVARIHAETRGADRAEALSLLFGSDDTSHRSALDRALADPMNTAGMHTGHGTSSAESADYGGRDAVFSALLDMSPDELSAVAQDPVVVARIRTALRANPSDLALFERLLAGADLGTDGGTRLPGAASLGEAVTTTGQPMADADKQRIRDHLVMTHSLRVERACGQGEDQMYSAAQLAFAERGETTVQAEPERKEDLFRDTERQVVWAAVRGAVIQGAGVTAERAAALTTGTASDGADQTYVAVRDGVLGVRDPSMHRLERGFDWWDNEENIDSAIDQAAPQTLANEWSNIRQPGPDSPTTMKQLWDRFAAARTASQEAAAAVASASDEDREALQAQATNRRREALLAEHVFRDFRLDVSASLAETLSQGRGLADRREGRGGGIGSLAETGDRRFLDLITRVRGRILALDNEVVARALGIRTEEYTASDEADETERTRLETERQADLGMLMTDDRRDRSRASHALDTYVHARGDGSLVDAFSSTDEAVDVSYARYMAEVGRAAEGDSATGTVGTIDSDEHERVDERREAFDSAVGEYRAAQAALANTLKWIAIAIITAVATALTGPGGPTLLAAMLSAAAQAGASAVIDEAVMGRDYEFWQEGMKDVVLQTATAAVTFGLNNAINRAVTASPFLSSASDKIARFRAWETALEEGATESWTQLGTYVLYSGGRAALGTGLSQFQDAVVGSIDPSEWKYGFRSGMTHTRGTFDGMLDGLPREMWESFYTTALTSAGTAIRGRLLPPPESPEGLSGIETGEAEETPEGASFWGSVGHGLHEATLSRDARDESIDYTVEFMVEHMSEHGAEFDSEHLGAFMTGLARNRVEGAISAAGDDFREDRNEAEAHRVLGRVMEDFRTRADLRGLDRAHAEAHLRHFLTTGVRDYDQAFEEWQRSWNGIETLYRRRLAEADDLLERSRYESFVFEDPAKISERLRYTPSEVAEHAAAAESTRLAIQASPEYRALDEEARAFYDAYLRDETRLLSTEGGGLEADVIDIREEAGATDFAAAYRQTKRAVILFHLREEMEGLPSETREAMTRFLGTADPHRDLPRIDPTNTAEARDAIEAWFLRNRPSWGPPAERPPAPRETLSMGSE